MTNSIIDRLRTILSILRALYFRNIKTCINMALEASSFSLADTLIEKQESSTTGNSMYSTKSYRKRLQLLWMMMLSYWICFIIINLK